MLCHAAALTDSDLLPSPVDLIFGEWRHASFSVQVRTSTTLWTIRRFVRERHAHVEKLRLFRGSAHAKNELVDFSLTLDKLLFIGGPRDANLRETLCYDFGPVRSDPVVQREPALFILPDGTLLAHAGGDGSARGAWGSGASGEGASAAGSGGGTSESSGVVLGRGMAGATARPGFDPLDSDALVLGSRDIYAAAAAAGAPASARCAPSPAPGAGPASGSADAVVGAAGSAPSSGLLTSRTIAGAGGPGAGKAGGSGAAAGAGGEREDEAVDLWKALGLANVKYSTLTGSTVSSASSFGGKAALTGYTPGLGLGIPTQAPSGT